MKHISDYYPDSIIMCEFCHRDIKDLGNMVQVTITRNPLEDNNIIEKHHIFCQSCWNRARIIIDNSEIKGANEHICSKCNYFKCTDIVKITGYCTKLGITRYCGDICIHEEEML